MGTARKAAPDTRGGLTLAVEIHGWRGIDAERNLFAVCIRLGFVTLFAARVPIIDRIIKMIGAYKLMRSGGEGVEMACAGEDPCERINHGKPLHVPSRDGNL